MTRSQTKRPSVPPLRYSVVVPVYNEAANIGPFCRKARKSLPERYELLICYDFEEDNTLPALANLGPEDKPAIVRLVKNDLGKGVRYAIEAGMLAATAPIVLVMMADLSDDFTKIEQMISLAESGAAVVCASRYAPGGRQIGGPWLKGMLSKAAGVSLHRITGLPTHDPTNSFKAYRKDFLDSTPIESTAGFCLAIELTVKAHFAGRIVEEVPACWYARTSGRSRFALFSWMHHYLRWYLWAIARRITRPAPLGTDIPRTR